MKFQVLMSPLSMGNLVIFLNEFAHDSESEHRTSNDVDSVIQRVRNFAATDLKFRYARLTIFILN